MGGDKARQVNFPMPSNTSLYSDNKYSLVIGKYPIQDNSTAMGKCEFGRRATVLLTCGALLTEARDTSGNAGPCNVSFVYLLRFFSSQDKIFSCVCHLLS